MRHWGGHLTYIRGRGVGGVVMLDRASCHVIHSFNCVLGWLLLLLLLVDSHWSHWEGV